MQTPPVRRITKTTFPTAVLFATAKRSASHARRVLHVTYRSRSRKVPSGREPVLDLFRMMGPENAKRFNEVQQIIEEVRASIENSEKAQEEGNE